MARTMTLYRGIAASDDDELADYMDDIKSRGGIPPEGTDEDYAPVFEEGEMMAVFRDLLSDEEVREIVLDSHKNWKRPHFIISKFVGNEHVSDSVIDVDVELIPKFKLSTDGNLVRYMY